MLDIFFDSAIKVHIMPIDAFFLFFFKYGKYIFPKTFEIDRNDCFKNDLLIELNAAILVLQRFILVNYFFQYKPICSNFKLEILFDLTFFD